MATVFFLPYFLIIVSHVLLFVHMHPSCFHTSVSRSVDGNNVLLFPLPRSASMLTDAIAHIVNRTLLR